MLLVHHGGMVRVHVSADVVGADDFRVAHGFGWLHGGRGHGPDRHLGLGARGARRDDEQQNESEVFHG